MSKRLLLLSGVAILAVVLNHAAGYGQIALFLWADRYLPVNVPYWEPLGSLKHYILLIIRSVGVFAVPAFLFISGFFSVYLVRGSKTKGKWKRIFRRIQSLVIPYLIWSIIIFIGEALQGKIYTPSQYIIKLLTTGAFGHLFYVPLLCYCYLLSPWVVSAAKRRPRFLLLTLFILLFGSLTIRYLAQFDSENVIYKWGLRLTPYWSPPIWLFYFGLGSVFALNPGRFREQLKTHKWHLLGFTVVFLIMNVIEGDFMLRMLHEDWIAGANTLSYHLYAFTATFCFLSLDGIKILGAIGLQKLGKQTYGIYLIHMSVIDVTARAIRQVVPILLHEQIILILGLFFISLFASLGMMAIVKRLTTTRRIYRYLFG